MPAAMGPDGLSHYRDDDEDDTIQLQPDAPDWSRVEELKNKLGYREIQSTSCCKPSNLLLGVLQVLLLLCIFAAAVWAKLSFLSLEHIIYKAHNKGTHPDDDDDDGFPSGDENEIKQRGRLAYAAVCLAIVVPYAWSLVWKVWRTPLFNDPQHMWPRGVQLAFIVLTALFESAGIAIFTLLVCPYVPSLLALGMMCLVFCLPRGHVLKGLLRCFRRRPARYQPLIYVHGDPERINTYAADIDGDDDDLRRGSHEMGRLMSLLGCMVQWVGIASIPILAVILNGHGHKLFIDETLTVAICGPVSIVLLAVAWWPVLHAKIGLPSIKHERTQRSAVTQMQSENTNAGAANININNNDEEDRQFGPMHRIKPSSTLRGSVLSLLLRCIFSAIAIYIITIKAYGDLEDDCPAHTTCDFWHNIKNISDNSDVLYALLGLLLCSFVAYHGARYSMMMGLQLAGFGIPLSLAPIGTGVLVVLHSLHGFEEHTHMHVHAKGDWWHFALFVVLASISMWLSNWSYIFARRIPRLGLDETLFYQNAYSAVFVDHFALISRRSSSRDEAEDDGDAKFVLSTEEVLKESSIYVCTTMYNESETEMEQLLRSVINSGLHLSGSCNFESHIFMDGGMQADNEPGNKALQLLRVLHRTIKSILGKKFFENAKAERHARVGRRISTPFGMRVELKLTEKFTIHIHLKDPRRVRKGKRWSQVMYMVYLTRYVLDFKKNGRSDNAYVLATDADINFTAHDVIALLMMMARDRGVGAVCGRTYPLGNGPLVWYQHFDYAVGHWFQKAAEHVLGTVLCCPGCFSLFRIDALREVVLEYSSHVDQAFDFLTKDMGEDRWLCTLLVTRGWRLEYCAAAKDRTYCPDSLEDFFKQRRRWIVSTVANMVQILGLGRVAVRRNPSVSYAYIAYTGLMLVSTVVSPATVLLVMIGGFNYVLGWDLVVVESILFATTFFYLLVCLFGSQQSQFLLAKILTGVFAIIMCLVFVGLLAQIADDIASATHYNGTSHAPPSPPGPPSPGPGPGPPTMLDTIARPIAPVNHTDSFNGSDVVSLIIHMVNTSAETLLGGGDSSNRGNNDGHHHHHHIGVGSGKGNLSMSSVYLLTMVGMFLLAGLMHLGEFTDLVHGVWYLLCLPTGYLFLLIYACCNLNDRSWGTRTSDPDGAGPGGSGGQRPTSWWKLLLFGCGLQPKESIIHFIGRVLCCRSYHQVQDVDVEEEKMALAKSDYVPLTWQLIPDISSTSATEYHVKCLPVSEAISLLRQPTKDREALESCLREAVLACPTLIDMARERSAAWLSSWNSELLRLESSFVDTILQQPDAARAMAEDFQLTMDKVTNDFRELQLTDLERARSHAAGLAAQQKLKTVKTVEEWVAELGFQDDEHLIDRLHENGYENTILLSYLEDRDLRTMGIHQLPSGAVLMTRMKAAAKAAARDRPPYQMADGLDQWLEALGLGEYWPHFEFFKYRPGDVQNYELMKPLDERRLKEMGIVKLAHVRRLTDALQVLKKRLRDTDDYKQAVKKTAEDSANVWADNDVGELADTELAFWTGVIEHILSPSNTGLINEDSLKEKLDSLKNRSVLAMVIINTMWLLFMLVLNSAVAKHLKILGTNPLGVLFILTYGALFALQFLTMLVHRFDTFVQYVATISVNNYIDSQRRGSKYTPAPREMTAMSSAASLP